MREGSKATGGVLGAPMTQRIFGHSHAMHVHGVAVHMHLGSRSVIIIF